MFQVRHKNVYNLKNTILSTKVIEQKGTNIEITPST